MLKKKMEEQDKVIEELKKVVQWSTPDYGFSLSADLVDNNTQSTFFIFMLFSSVPILLYE